MEVVASLSQGRTAAAQCGLFTRKSVPVIFEPPCTSFTALVLPKLKSDRDYVEIYTKFYKYRLRKVYSRVDRQTDVVST